MLTRAPTHLSGWIEAIGSAEIPVLERTARAIDALRADEDDIAPRDIAEVILDDPLMTLKLLAEVPRLRPGRQIAATETVTAALLMMGVGTFFRTYSGQTTVESTLAGVPGALEGIGGVLRRAHRAARFAIGFAMYRQDTDAEIIHEAALLHDFAEALLWCHAPRLALEIQHRQAADPTLRSVQIQREVLHVELCDLEQALMKAWRLPELLQHLTNDHLARVPRVRNVLLATALARHSQHGWDNAALPDDLSAIAALLNVSEYTARVLIRELDPEPESLAVSA